MKKTIFVLSFIVIINLGAGLVMLNDAVAWTEPSSAPPQGNVEAPIHVGGKLQSKTGGLGLNGANASTKFGLTVKAGTEAAIDTFNNANNGQVRINHASNGVKVFTTKANYNGLYSWIGGAESNAAYLVNTDLSGRGLYVLSEGVGGIITGDETGLLVSSASTGVHTTSEKVGLISVLEKNNANVSQTKLNFFDDQKNPIGLGAYNQADGSQTTSYAELALTDIGIRAQGNQFAGYFDGPVHVTGTLNVGKGCNGCKDLAEAMLFAEQVEAGEVVALNKDLRLIKATKNDQTVIGVVSTQAALTLNDAATVNGAPVALSGIVPVKVINENGAIRPGDFITASSLAGYGMKATQPTTIVGKALESFSGHKGEIKIFVDLGWFGGTCKK